MEKYYQRIFLIVLDSLGIGNAKDAKKFGDEGANTLAHIAQATNGIKALHLEGLGLGALGDFQGIYNLPAHFATIAKLNEKSNGKDTMIGHWEMMGLEVKEPFQTFTEKGFPQALLDELSKRCDNRQIIGNYAASGTEIIDELGEEQIKTGALIVYTSADSVLQIAAHEKYIGLDNLYRYCEIARELTMKNEWKVGRVIARPYVGERKGEFKRTRNRHDYALSPFGKTVLDDLKDKQLEVISVGKINDIFNGQGITQAYSSKSNEDGMKITTRLCQEKFKGLVFTNLVDFDALYGHRRDVEGYKQAIEAFDKQLGDLLFQLKEDDLLILTADHGNDPTYKGTDHTREQVFLLMYSKKMTKPINLGEQNSFACIGATIADNFGVSLPSIAESLLKYLQ